MPCSHPPDKEELASEGDSRGRTVGDERPRGASGRRGVGGSRAGAAGEAGGAGAQGPEGNNAAGEQEARKGFTLKREEGRGQDSGAREGPFQRGTCQQRDRRSARAPHPEAGVGTSWELEGELDHCRVGPLESPFLMAPLLPCPGMSLNLQGAGAKVQAPSHRTVSWQFRAP